AGAELWVTDGTSAGTVLLKDTFPGSSSGSPSELVALGPFVLFRANSGTTGQATGLELWRTDGTAAGTVEILDIQKGVGHSSPTGLVVLDGKVLFRADDGKNGSELWVSNGTTAGTTMVKDINVGGAA